MFWYSKLLLWHLHSHCLRAMQGAERPWDRKRSRRGSTNLPVIFWGSTNGVVVVHGTVAVIFCGIVVVLGVNNRLNLWRWIYLVTNYSVLDSIAVWCWILSLLFAICFLNHKLNIYFVRNLSTHTRHLFKEDNQQQVPEKSEVTIQVNWCSSACFILFPMFCPMLTNLKMSLSGRILLFQEKTIGPHK